MQLFDEVVVSTEDTEIASIAISAGAFVHFRDLNLADDEASLDQVCRNVILDRVCDIFCCVYATAALLNPKPWMLHSRFSGNSRSGCTDGRVELQLPSGTSIGGG